MTAHKFKIGHRVTLGSKRFGQRGETFEVSRQMPEETGQFQTASGRLLIGTSA